MNVPVRSRCCSVEGGAGICHSFGINDNTESRLSAATFFHSMAAARVKVDLDGGGECWWEKQESHEAGLSTIKISSACHHHQHFNFTDRADCRPDDQGNNGVFGVPQVGRIKSHLTRSAVQW